MQNSKHILELEKRKERAKTVTVRLSSTSMHGFHFNVYNDEEDKLKYIGEISQDHVHDECGCMSFMKSNTENYQKTNPLPFQCKHIIAAHDMMEGYW